MRAALIPWALSGGAAVTVGFGRFAYALILPAMQTSLGLSYAQAGWLNTSNSLGYLLGSILTALYVERLGNHRLFVAGMLVTTLSLLANGLVTDFYLLNIIRFITGLSAAWAFISGGVLASLLGARAMVIYFGGGGSGMLLSGASLPWLFEFAGPQAWPWAWAGTAALCTPITIAALAAARYSVAPAPTRQRTAWSWRPCAPAFLAYFMFGLGYIAYMTFIIAWVRLQAADSLLPMAAISSIMWTLLGVMCMMAPRVWSGVFAAHTNGLPMAFTMVTLGAGALLPLLVPNLAGIWASAALVGVSVLMVPSGVTGFVKNNLPAAAWGSALALATTLFAIGQTIGPVAAGWISDLAGNLSVGLGLSAGILFAGAILAWMQAPLTPALRQQPGPAGERP